MCGGSRVMGVLGSHGPGGSARAREHAAPGRREYSAGEMPQAATAQAPAPGAEPAPRLPREPAHVWRLERATWADFQRLLELRGEHPVPRFAYLEGTLEIMSPSRSHEHIKSMIGRLVEAWCIERGVDIMPYGSWLLESKTHRRGIEPD